MGVQAGAGEVTVSSGSANTRSTADRYGNTAQTAPAVATLGLFILTVSRRHPVRGSIGSGSHLDCRATVPSHATTAVRGDLCAAGLPWN